MKVAFITRSTLHKVPGGDTTMVRETARHLSKLGIDVTVLLADERVSYDQYDLFHFFNIIRPADILAHTTHIKKPYFISPLLVDYSEYDKLHRKGFSGFILRNFSSYTNEYIKTIARWITGKDKLRSKKYIWKGQKRSMKEILKKAAAILPNSEAEGIELKNKLGIDKPSFVIPNGIDDHLFVRDATVVKDEKLVLCAARIEGIKNQFNLVTALNDTAYTLILIGAPAPNQKDYYTSCRKIAADNIQFKEHLPQESLISFYKKAKVHVLPSWFETCGLSSLEAAAMGCNVVITDKGYTREYFGNEAEYCDPDDPQSIFKAIDTASKKELNKNLPDKISKQYTWEKAAAKTLEVYKKFIQ